MIKKIVKYFFIVSLLLININAFAWYRTPEAGRSFFWSFSADLLSRGVGNGGTIMPSGIAVNPAGNAFAQRLKFEIGYGVAPGLWSEWTTSLYQDSLDSTDDQINAYRRNRSFQNGADFFMPSYGNFGFLISTKYGNFTGYSTYMNFGNDPWGANNNDLGAGKIGTIYFGFSKDYNEHFAFGVSGNVKIAYNEHSKYTDNKFDVGGGFDFGFIFRPGWVTYFNKKKAPHWGFQDWEFSIALKEIGKPLINMPDGVDVVDGYDDLTWFGDPFTINGGISFNIFNDGATYWKWLFDVGTPFFQNFRTSIGTEVQIYKFLVLRTAYTFDLEGVLEYAGVIPLYEYMYSLANVNFGLSLRFTSDFFKKQTKEEAYANRHKRTEFSIDLGGKPYHDGFMFQLGCSITIGAKDETPPEISYIAKDYYISPNLDGVQDNLNVDLTINDDRYVMYWKFEIYDRDGKVVRTIESKEQRAETMKFTDVVKKYFRPKQGVPIPKTLIWDGRDNGGQVVEDGTYTYKFFAMDDNSNMDPAGSAAGQIIIKTDKPLIEHKTQNVIFSPNNDGQKDTLIIDLDIIRDNVEPQFIPIEELDLSENDIQALELPTVNAQVKDETVDIANEKKQLWYVDILDNLGHVVKTFELTQRGKVRLEWDGTNNNGELMPDGVYKVKLHSVDLAGNYWEDFITNIIINTEATPIELKLHDKTFSPNGDGVKDTVSWTINIPNKNGIEKWDFAVRDSNNNPIKTFSGQGEPPTVITWDGKTDDDKAAAEGHYTGYLLVTYINGNTPHSVSSSLELDVQKPEGKVKFSLSKFSPDGDGVKDTVDIEQTTSYEEQWIGQIADESGKTVKSYMWKGQPPKKFTWDGIDDNNNLLADGKYYYTLRATDLAGNDFETSPSPVEIFTKETPVFITALQSYFSPGTKSPIKEEVLSIRDSTSADNKVSEWKLDIKDDKDTLVYTKSGKDSLPNEYKWNGTDSSGKIVLDGAYYASLDVHFESGTSSHSQTTYFNIDTVAPTVDIKALTVDLNGSPVFSPNNDGYMDEMEIGQVGSKEDLWESAVYDKSGNAVWSAFTIGEPKQTLVWDGKDAHNNMCENGIYRYVITSTDKAGNSCTETIDNIELKNVRTTIFVTIDKNAFASELGDTDDNKVSLTPMLNVKDDLLAYKMDIKDSQQNVVRSFTGEKSVPQMIQWDGHDQNGTVLPDGEYHATMSGIYRFGNRPTVDSEQFVLDNTPPDIDVTYRPKLFSPDNDGNDDDMTIGIAASDLTGIEEWKLTVMNPTRTREFISFGGKGNPTPSIVWNGISSEGELVESAEDYPVRITAVDNVGNKIDKFVKPIEVDILVEKLDDGRLKIRISNIEFKPNSSQMTDSDKNKKIIDRLSVALKKYSSYNVTIEGHANRFMTSGKFLDDVARKLSQDRADYIMNALIGKGIAKKRLVTTSKSGDEPVFTPPEGWQKGLSREEFQLIKEKIGKNRRVEFYLDKNN